MLAKRNTMSRMSHFETKEILEQAEALDAKIRVKKLFDVG